jgi:hypothetical protein
MKMFQVLLIELPPRAATPIVRLHLHASADNKNGSTDESRRQSARNRRMRRRMPLA